MRDYQFVNNVWERKKNENTKHLKVVKIEWMNERKNNPKAYPIRGYFSSCFFSFIYSFIRQSIVLSTMLYVSIPPFHHFFSSFQWWWPWSPLLWNKHKLQRKRQSSLKNQWMVKLTTTMDHDWMLCYSCDETFINTLL